MSSLRAVFLCRGSSYECDDQETDLLGVADLRGWAIVRTLKCGWSPAAARRSRDCALRLILDGEAGILCVAAIGIVVDGIVEGIEFLADLAEVGGHLYSAEGMNTWDDGYDFLATCQRVAGWAETGRSNRIRAGLEATAGSGKRLGRPPAQVDPERLRVLLQERLPMAEIARRLEINRRSLGRAIERHGLSALVPQLP